MKTKNTTEISLEEVLEKLARRVEEIAIDTHATRNELGMIKLRLGTVEHNTEMMKIDIEKLKSDSTEMKRNVESLIVNSSEILTKMVTQEEHQGLAHRVAKLETQ